MAQAWIVAKDQVRKRDDSNRYWRNSAGTGLWGAERIIMRGKVSRASWEVLLGKPFSYETEQS